MTRQSLRINLSGLACCAGIALAAVAVLVLRLQAQTQFTEPVYRVAAGVATQGAVQPVAAQQPIAQQPVAQQTAASAPAVQPPAGVPAAGATPFDLTAQPGEHPLAPVIRICKASVEHIDRNIKDYSCTLIKRERLPDEPAIGDPQQINMRIRHEPFSVHMAFVQPHAGRKVVWVSGQNENKLTVREGGLLGLVKVDFHPESTTAMKGQKYPIYKIGIKNLLLELIKNFEADTKYAESEVKINPKDEFNKRPATSVQVKHPVPRQNFRSHWARIYFDNELKIPIYYDAYMWPAKDGETPPMEESFAYTNLKVNNGFTARDFDKENAENFK
jgi:hypothetical protein